MKPLIPTVLPLGYAHQPEEAHPHLLEVARSRLPEVVRQIDEVSRLLTLELQAADRRSRRAEMIYEARHCAGEVGRIIAVLIELL